MQCNVQENQYRDNRTTLEVATEGVEVKEFGLPRSFVVKGTPDPESMC